MAKAHTHEIEASGSMAYDALRRAVGTLGFSVLRADGRSQTIQFQAKRGLMSSKVNASAMVVEGADGRSRISMTGKDAAGALTTWGENGRVAQAVFHEVDRILPELAKQEASSEGGYGRDPGSITVELERLARLQSSGAIDETEFQLAKDALLRRPDGLEVQAGLGARGMVQPSSRGNVIGAAAAGAVGGMLISNVGVASASSGSGEPTADHVEFHDTVMAPDGSTTSIEGSSDSTVTFDESGDAHVEIHDEGAVTMEDGEVYEYASDVEGDVDMGGGNFDSGGGFFDVVAGLFG